MARWNVAKNESRSSPHRQIQRLGDLAERFVLVTVLDFENPNLGGAGGGQRFGVHDVAAAGGEADLLARLAGAGEPGGVALELAFGAGEFGMAAGIKIA